MIIENISKNIIKEFSRFSKEYNSYSIVQSKVAKKLVSNISKKYFGAIADIGCGTGLIYKSLVNANIIFDLFYAYDGSLSMLSSHPQNPKIIKQYFDFNSIESFENILDIKYDIVISSSALQWSIDLDFSVSNISKMSNCFYGSLFTNNTFKTLHKVAGISSPIHSVQAIKRSFNKFYKNVNFEIVSYRLFFDSKKDLFSYIKKSGVSGGEKRLSIAQTKKLISEYNMNYLEFEVIFIIASN